MSLSLTPLGGLRHDGTAPLDPNTTLITLIGGADVDLRGAPLPAGGATLTKVSLIGGVSVTAPRGVRVEVTGFSLLGGRDIERDASTPAGAPLLRVRAFGLIGGVKVRLAD
jgi:hypothetical protein